MSIVRSVLGLMLILSCITGKAQSSSAVSFSGAKKMMDKGNYKEAEAAFQNLNQKNPEDPDILYYLGECNFFLNYPEKAISCYSSSLEKFAAESGKDGSKYEAFNRKVSERIKSCKMIMNETGTNTSNVPESKSVPPPSTPPPPAPIITGENPDLSVKTSNTGTNTNETSADVLISDFRMFEDNPTSMAKFQKKSPPEGWRLPTINELRGVLAGVIKESKNKSEANLNVFVSQDEDIYFISSDYTIYEGIKKFKCLSIQNNKIQDEQKEDTELVSVLFIKN